MALYKLEKESGANVSDHVKDFFKVGKVEEERSFYVIKNQNYQSMGKTKAALLKSY